jgi:hypothetical protein
MQDRTRCEAVAESAVTAADRTDSFTACMVVSGYRVATPVRVGAEHALVDVSVRRDPPVAQVRADLETCGREVQERMVRYGHASSDQVVAGTIGGLFSSDLAHHRTHRTSTTLAGEYASCLLQRGYDASPSGQR